MHLHRSHTHPCYNKNIYKLSSNAKTIFFLHFTVDIQFDGGANPPLVYGLIAFGVTVLLIIITVLIVTLALLYRAKCRLTTKKAHTDIEIASEADQQTSQNLPAAFGYDDILSVSEVMRNNCRPEENDNIVYTNEIPTTHNEAYGVAGLSTQTHIQSSAHKREQNESEYENIKDNISGKTCIDGKTTNNKQDENRSFPSTKDDAPDYENILSVTEYSADDDHHDYENLYSDNDDESGNYIVPEFDRVSNEGKVQSTFKTVEYSYLRGYPESGGMKSSISLPDILDKVKPKPVKKKKKEKKPDKSDRNSIIYTWV